MHCVYAHALCVLAPGLVVLDIELEDRTKTYTVTPFMVCAMMGGPVIAMCMPFDSSAPVCGNF